MKDLSNSVLNAKPSSIRALFELVLKAKNAISFGIGQPNFTPPDHVLDAIKKSLIEKKTQYAPTLGLPHLRAGIAKKFREENNLKWVTPKNVIVTNGGSHALQLTFASLSNPGDEMIVSSPNFISYYYLPGFFNMECVEVGRKDDFSPDFEGIRKSITPKTKFIMINSPNNPTGYVYTKNQMDEMVEIVKENDLYLVSDEVYEKFLFEDGQSISPASYPEMQDRTLTLNAMSKSFGAPGLRFGYIAAPEHIINMMEKYAQYTAAGVSHPTQYGAIAAMELGNPGLDSIIKEYNQKRLYCVKRLQELNFTINSPKGAFYLMPGVSNFKMTGDEFAEALMKEYEVAVVPGSGFGSHSVNNVRISYATDDDKLEEGFDRIEKFLKSRNLL